MEELNYNQTFLTNITIIGKDYYSILDIQIAQFTIDQLHKFIIKNHKFMLKENCLLPIIFSHIIENDRVKAEITYTNLMLLKQDLYYVVNNYEKVTFSLWIYRNNIL